MSEGSGDMVERGDVSWSEAPGDETLWGVYGPDCFPTIFACKMKDYFWYPRAIWGFSIHEGDAGFRTLGAAEVWAAEHDLRLFLTREAAFAHIASLFPPFSQPMSGEEG